MKAFLTILVVSMLFAGVLVAAGADGALDLSTLGKKPVITPVSLPRLTPTSPTSFGADATGQEVLDLSTLNKKSLAPAIDAVTIEGATPITITPAFSIKNANSTVTLAPTVYTPPIAISSQTPIVYTPPIAIYGGA